MPIGRTKKSSSSRKSRNTSFSNELQMNFAILGSSNCGKTSLVKRFLCNSYNDKYNPTLMDVFEESFILDEMDIGMSYRIFDTTGSDDFPAMRQLAIDSADTFVIVYAVDDRRSFENAKRVKMEVSKSKGVENDVPIMLVANKCDVDDRARVVSPEEGRSLARQWGCFLVECSAKFSQNIECPFTEPMIKMLKQKYPEHSSLDNKKIDFAVAAR